MAMIFLDILTTRSCEFANHRAGSQLKNANMTKAGNQCGCDCDCDCVCVCTGVLDVTKKINNYTNLGYAQNDELHKNMAKSEPTWILFLCGGGGYIIIYSLN